MNPAHGTVMVVDDDRQVREAVGNMLSEVGYNVVLAKSGGEAIRIVEHGALMLDVVLTDVVMRGMFGDELGMRLAEIDPSLPVVFMSGNSVEAVESQIEMRPGENFIRKPFGAHDLLPLIERALVPDGRST